jgi:hypothetical protein
MHLLRLLALTAATAATTIAQCAPQWLPGEPIGSLSGNISTSAVWDPDGSGPAGPLLVVAGTGITGGEVGGSGVAAWNGTQWLRLGTPPSGDGQSIAIWNGNLVVAFSTASTASAAVARFDGTNWQVLGTCDSPGISPILNVAVHQGDLYAGGSFQQMQGVAANYVARYDGSSWSALGAGAPHPVAHLESFQGLLYAAANRFSSPIQGQLLTWNGSAWNLLATANSYIRKLAFRAGLSITNTYIYAGGLFTQWTGVNGTVAGPLVRFSPATNAWTGLGFPSTSSVMDIELRSTGLNTFEAVVVDYNGLWQQISGVWTQLGTAVANSTSATYYGGAWHLMTYGPSPRAQRLQSGAWVPLTPTGGSLGRVLAARDDGADLLVGGSFGLRRGQPGNWTSVGGLSGTVERLARLANGDWLVSGTFATPNLPQSARRIARWDGTTWTALTSSLNGPVLAFLPLPNGEVIAGGSFTNLSGTGIPYLARWNGSSWQPLGGGVNNTVRSLARLGNGDIIAGGDFTLAGTVTGTALYVARWNGNSWSPMSTTSTGTVPALVVDSNDAVVALIASLGARRWSNNTWVPIRQTLATALVALPGGDLALAGDAWIEHTDAQGVLRSSVPCSGVIDDLFCAADGDLIVAGDIQGVDKLASVGVARRNAPCPASANSYGTACTGPGGPLLLQATELPWLGSSYRARTTGFTANMLGFSIVGFTPQATPLPSLLPGSGACNLLVNPISNALLLPVAGVTTHQLAMPTANAFAGMVLLDQVLALAVSGNGNLLYGSNGLELRLGTVR